MIHIKTILATFFALLLTTASYSFEIKLIADGLSGPVDLADPDDGSGRMFIVEQQGLVRVLEADGLIRETPFLDLRQNLVELDKGFEERGLLGFALHPDFASNGRVYASYSARLRPQAPTGWNYTRRISEFTAKVDNREIIDTGTERVLLELDWPSRKHNGGGLAFGPDGYLYIGIGDGGGAHGVGKKVLWSAFDVPAEQLYWDRLPQDITTLFGSILRIDVDRGFPGYGVPETNPFVGKPGRDEIFAWGFRNPYRITFDASGTGDFLVTAVAETLWESIYLISGPGNFGWPIREGTHCVDRTAPRTPPETCARTGPNGYRIKDPIVEYPNMQVMHPESKLGLKGVGTAVVGGRIYRGKAMPELSGKLVFADWSAAFQEPSGQLFVATPPARLGELWSFEKVRQLDTRIVSIAENRAGELFIMTNDDLNPFGQTGKVFQLVASP